MAPGSIGFGPEPTDDHGYLVRVYDLTRRLCEQFEELGQVVDVQASRIQILEAHQVALSGVVAAVGELAKRVDTVERASLSLPDLHLTAVAHAKRLEALELWKAATVTKLVMGSVLAGTILGVAVNMVMTWLTTGRGP